MSMRRSLNFVLISLLIPFSVFGFGKNKIQYREHAWKVHRTEKFNIIYYEGGEDLALFTRDILETAYQRLEDALAHTLRSKIPVIIYNSHHDFEETNVIPDIIEESVGGFTEVYKNRVVVPFTGSYEDFRHVLVHEFTHAFQFDILYGRGLSSIISQGLYYEVPLWFLEGMAEYFSLNWDAESDMVMRDAIHYDSLVTIQELYRIEGTYLMYKEGQSILKFIADRYGEKKIGEIFRKVSSTTGLRGAVKAVLGINLKELNRLWMNDLKKKCWEQLASMDEVPSHCRRLTRHKNYTYNIAPSMSPDGSEIAFLSDRKQYENMYLMSAIDGKLKRKLVGGGKSEGFESLHISHGVITWSPSGKKIAFTAKGKGKDWIYIMDIEKRKIKKKFSCDVDAIFSPSWSPDGTEIAFRGLKDGKADIYVLDMGTGDIRALTHDLYDDITPSWSSDGKYLVFSSDRPALQDSTLFLVESVSHRDWHYGLYTLFKMKRDGSSITQIMKERASSVSYPLWGEDKIFFISNRSGVNNLYTLDPGTQEIAQLTNVVGGVFTPSISKDGKYIAFSLYLDYGWDIFAAKTSAIREKEICKEKDFPKYYIATKGDTTHLNSDKLGFKVSSDYAIGTASYSTGYGFTANAEIAFSDILGNHQLYIISDSPSNLLEDFYILYWYLPKRIDVGVGIFREQYSYYLASNVVRTEEFIGGSALLSYPFDKFRRVELGFDAYNVGIQDYVYGSSDGVVGWWKDASFNVPIISPYISYVTDNTIWGSMGPVNGERSKIGLLSTLPITSNTLRFNFFQLDYRKYIRIAPKYTVALRLINGELWGKDVDAGSVSKLQIGGAGTVRGYEYGDFEGKNVGALNLEFRYPFIDYLRTSFPIPMIVQGIRGALFLDLGYAKDNLSEFRLFNDGRLDDLKMGFGTGLRIGISGYVVQFDIAKHTDLKNISNQTYYTISLGSEF
jgi:Tol biopolymer transport system component